MGHRARHCDLDPISRTPYGPAARNVPHQEAAHTTGPDLTATDFGTTSGLPTRGASTYDVRLANQGGVHIRGLAHDG